MGRKQRSDVRPNSRVIVGLVCGGLSPSLVLHEWSVRSIVGGLVGGALCVAVYLAWLYGRDWYERRIIAKHTYRPEDR